MNFNDIKYERPNLEEFETKLENIALNLQNADSYDNFKNLFFEQEKLLQNLFTQSTICSIRNSIDTTDEFYEKEIEFWDTNTPKLTKYITNIKKIILSSKFIDKLKEDISKPYFMLAENELNAFDEKIMEDLVEENKLVTKYSKLLSSAKVLFDGKERNLSQLSAYSSNKDRQIRKDASLASDSFFLEHQKEFDEIYDELVKVRTKIAKKLGYKNYTELGYIRMNRLDYNESDVENYRNQIIKYVVPVANEIYASQAKRIGLDKLENMRHYDMNLSFIDGNPKPIGTPEEILEAGREMYHDLSDETKEFIDIMLDDNLMDVLAKEGKRPGGYMTFLYNYGVPFIFSNFNGTLGDVDVLTHEAGHAFQGYMSRDIYKNESIAVHMPTMESCEIHSMSMEFLTWPYMEKFFGKDADKYKYCAITDSICFLPYGAQVDHFQHEVYNNPDMTPAERRELWTKLDKIYRPSFNFEESKFLSSGGWWYKQSHIFSTPFYYIDYTLAQVCAFQFWKRSFVDNDPNTWEDYLKICKCGGTKTFTEIVEYANLKNPFKNDTLKDIMDSAKDYITNSPF